MEGVRAWGLANQIVSFDLHEADGADVAVVAKGESLKYWHFGLKVGDVVDLWHFCHSSPHSCHCSHRSQSPPSGDENGTADDEEESDEGPQSDEYVVVDEEAFDHSL